MTFSVEKNEAAGPHPISLFGAQRIVPEAAGLAETFCEATGARAVARVGEMER